MISAMSSPFMLIRNVFTQTIGNLILKFVAFIRDYYLNFKLSGEESFERSVWLFAIMYIVLFSPLIFVFVLGKGSVKKQIDERSR
jgi:hypothetical protein